MTELERLQQRLAQLQADNRQLEADKLRVVAENRQLQDSLAEKERELEALLQRFFGRKSERFVDPRQLTLDFGDRDQVGDAVEGMKQAIEEHETEVAGYTRRRPRNEKLPDNLPREMRTLTCLTTRRRG